MYLVSHFRMTVTIIMFLFKPNIEVECLHLPCANMSVLLNRIQVKRIPRLRQNRDNTIYYNVLSYIEFYGNIRTHTLRNILNHYAAIIVTYYLLLYENAP